MLSFLHGLWGFECNVFYLWSNIPSLLFNVYLFYSYVCMQYMSVFVYTCTCVWTCMWKPCVSKLASLQFSTLFFERVSYSRLTWMIASQPQRSALSWPLLSAGVTGVCCWHLALFFSFVGAGDPYSDLYTWISSIFSTKPSHHSPEVPFNKITLDYWANGS